MLTVIFRTTIYFIQNIQIYFLKITVRYIVLQQSIKVKKYSTQYIYIHNVRKENNTIQIQEKHKLKMVEF